MWTTNSVADTSAGRQSNSGMYPTRWRMVAPSVATSSPSTLAWPDVAGSSPSRIFSNVDLPAPLAPTRPTTPGAMSSVSSLTAVTAGNRLTRLWVRIKDIAAP